MKKLPWFAAVSGGLLAAAGLMQAIAWAQTAETPKPKHTIKEVMEKAHKGGLMGKVADGKASPEEKAELLDLYISLSDNEPPQGDSDSFHKLANNAVLGAARVVVGREGAEKDLKKAVACPVCHKAHKPPAK
jgi:hypothetical protein